MDDTSHRAIYYRFKEILEAKQAASEPFKDPRSAVLSAAQGVCGFGYVEQTLRTGYGSNLRATFNSICGVDNPGFEQAKAYFIPDTEPSVMASNKYFLAKARWASRDISLPGIFDWYPMGDLFAAVCLAASSFSLSRIKYFFWSLMGRGNECILSVATTKIEAWSCC